MAKVYGPWEPNFAVPPGETVKESMEEHGLTVEQLAEAAGIRQSQLEDIIAGEAPITEMAARRLERALGVPARLWLRLESNYIDTLGRAQQQYLESVAELEVSRRKMMRRAVHAVVSFILIWLGWATVFLIDGWPKQLDASLVALTALMIIACLPWALAFARAVRASRKVRRLAKAVQN